MRSLITILLLFGLCLSCSNENDNPFGFTGSASAIKNNESWRANIRVGKNIPFNIGLNINFLVLNQQGFERESMAIYRVKAHLNRQTIHLTNAQIKNDSIGVFYTTLIDDGDILGDIYSIDTTYQDNYIQLTNIDSKKCEITGVFNVRLILIRDDNDGPPPPNVIEFTNGQFTSRIKKEWLD
jgi:hypothetical protein